MNYIKFLVASAFLFVSVGNLLSQANNESYQGWQYHPVMGWIHIGNSPWLWTELGWIYSLDTNPGSIENSWNYLVSYGWFWMGESSQSSCYSNILGSSFAYFSWDNFSSAVTSGYLLDNLLNPQYGSIDGDKFEILGVELNGGILSFNVTYKGGCALHHFYLIGNEFVYETNPPQVELKLVHNSNGDTCEKIETSSPEFNIEPLIESWRHSYAEMLIKVNSDLEWGSAELLISLSAP